MQTNNYRNQTDPYPPDLATLSYVLGFLELLAGVICMIFFWSKELGPFAALSISFSFISSLFFFATGSGLTYLKRIHSTLKGVYNK